MLNFSVVACGVVSHGSKPIKHRRIGGFCYGILDWKTDLSNQFVAH